MKHLLLQYGFTEKEAEVYVASLELGQATGFEIYRKTDLKKPTVYYVLDELQKKGFVFQTKKGNKRYFVAEHPEKIKKELLGKVKVFDELLPELMSIHNAGVGRPKLRFYEGKEGIKEVYEDTLKYHGEILAFASEQLLKSLGKEYSDAYVSKRVELQIPVRAIIPASKTLLERYMHDSMRALRNVRLADEKKYNFPVEINIYANKVAFMSFRDELGLIVESDEINKMMRMLFESFWKSIQ
ncbi:MAG: hypothetical protein HGA67_01585 [Candidatus Yonathbacteria bacterium]|nr:hypothetical protein [Candidatus Yonathbacteria bacterium]